MHQSLKEPPFVTVSNFLYQFAHVELYRMIENGLAKYGTIEVKQIYA